MQSSVVIFRAHQDLGLYREALQKLRTDLPHLRVEVVSYLKQKLDGGIFQGGYVVDADDLRKLPYEVKLGGFNPDNSAGYNELPVMHFFRANPNYDFYWIVECDVLYTGSWAALFETLSSSQADLLGTTVAVPSENPEWCHWAGLRHGEAPLPPEVCIKSFMPFGRVSRAALTAIDQAYIDGFTGHPEGIWPTVCRMRNLTIEDLGGDSAYTPDRWKKKHYWNTLRIDSLSPGSFVCGTNFARADIDATAFPGTLWHPVKS